MSEISRPTLVQPRKPEDIQRSGALVAREAGGSTVADFFDLHKDSIKAVLPQHMTPDRMLKIALRALRTTPKLMNCTINSLFGAVVTCAQLGLEPNTPQGHIYLIPFENRKKQTYEVQVIVGYKGLIDLARRSGEIVSISSHAVFDGDPFDVMFGTDESVTHRPKLQGDRGHIVGFYAVAKLVGGGTQFEFMSTSDVNKIRDGSQGYKTAIRFNKQDTPWISSYEQMGRKTVIRRLCNYLPMSIELANAVALEGRAEKNESQSLDQVLAGDYSLVSDEVEHDFDPDTGEVHEGEQPGADEPRDNGANAGAQGEQQPRRTRSRSPGIAAAKAPQQQAAEFEQPEDRPAPQEDSHSNSAPRPAQQPQQARAMNLDI